VAADQQPPQVVTDFRIYQNFPNPFNAGTTFSYNLSKPAQVKLDLFNLQGERVQTLVDNFLSAGYHRIKWDGFTGQGILAASGTYIAQFNINQQRQLIKLQMVK
jgi:flagellar hook assembly protein FlgD